MDVEYIFYSSLMAISIIIIVTALIIMLPTVGHSETREIKRKAMRYVLPIALFMLIFETGKELYALFRGIPYEPQSSYALLGSISTLYLISYLYLKVKHRKQSDVH